jgi:hypothetical protein
VERYVLRGGEWGYQRLQLLARQAAEQRGLSNVEFRAVNVNDWDEPGAYDLVYSRTLLQHLSRT